MTTLDLTVPRLGRAQRPSPLGLSTADGDQIANYTPDDARVRLDPTLRAESSLATTGQADTTAEAHAPAAPLSFELAGPRERLYFDPAGVTAGIVTCGGLCPGLNTVVRTLTIELLERYRARQVLGFRYGYLGLTPAGPAPLALDQAAVDGLHHQAGSVLGTSRGPQDVGVMLDTCARLGVSQLYTIGGDGTLRGARALHEEAARRGQELAVVGVPKTIDNDVPFIERTFGYQTAVELAVQAIRAAHVEAAGALHGLGLVQLMGRHSGFIAASAALSSLEADLVLIPEQPFTLAAIASHLARRIAERGHAVAVVAEGAGQDLLAPASGRDASGNARLAEIGLFLRQELPAALAAHGLLPNLKYIDPSYIIRAAPASPADTTFCAELGAAAVHAAMSGRTGLVVGLWNGAFTHVPLAAATSARKLIDLDGPFWGSVVAATRQPYLLAEPA